MIDEYSLKKSYPLCYEYLSSIKERLEKRGSVNMKYTSWYSLWNSRNSDNLNSIKIITPDVRFGTDMTFDYLGQYYYNDTAYAFIKKPNCKFDYRYLISILNSKITWFFIKNTGTMLRGGYFRFKTSYLENFKFPSATQDQQQSLVQKAGQMIELNKQLHEEIQKSLNLIQTEYKPNKISKNLEKFYTLGLNVFFDELEKQKVKLSLIEKEELCDWYKQKSDKLNDIKQKITALDNAIDKDVYTLYNLTDEEIKIIEKRAE